MSRLFRSSSPEAPKQDPVPPPPAPTVSDAAVRVREEADNSRRRRRGRAASVLTGSDGAGVPQSATATLGGF